MAGSCTQVSLRPNKLHSAFDHGGDEVRLRPYCSHTRLEPPPFSTMYILLCVEHLLLAKRFTHIAFSQTPHSSPDSLLCVDVADLRCNSTPDCGPSGLSLPRRSIGSHNYGEGAERCNSRRARQLGRQPGDLGPGPQGERQLSMSRSGTEPPRGQPGAGAERRGGEGRGARGGTKKGRWHQRLRLGALRKSRSESCERLEEARSAKSGNEVRSLEARCCRTLPLPPVQPETQGAGDGRRWSSLEL